MKAEKLGELIDFLEKEGIIKKKEVTFKDKKREVYILRLKKEIYDKDSVFTAAYYVIDDENYVFIDKEDEFWKIYFFTNKDKVFLFFNFLINYLNFRKNNKESLKIKEELIKLFLSG
ncbi:MAG TPA: hypothetical protein EYH54_00105 [Nautiliaceae bacterium]|nr:hypothetical protein [Nautiliaceae bacterium]